MMTPQIIGLYGDSRAGKDETAAILVADFGYEKRAQAAAIRRILLDLDPVIQGNNGTFYTMQHMFEACEEDWDKVKAFSSDSTDYMIRLGQSARDNLGINVWLEAAFPAPNYMGKVVISDIRQVNEYEAVKARGGEVWRITRPGTVRRAMDGLLDHLTFDTHIRNIGSLADLRGLVQASIATNMDNATKKLNSGIR